MTNPHSGSTVYRNTPSGSNKTTKRCNSSGSASGTRGRSGNPNPNNNTQPMDSATKHDSKRQKMDWDLEPFDKLHPNENAQKILSRYKMILKGKNTVGYTQYTQQVPKQQRRIRSMDTPNTPDHTLDIPAKRWQGLVKAWRVALHKYDPPDLVSPTTGLLSQPNTDENTVTKTPVRCVSIGKDQPDSSTMSPTMDETTPPSVKRSSPHSKWFDDNDDDEVDGNQRKAARNLDFDDMLDVDADDALGFDDPDDSDDDLI